jgi:hypothetical protein
MADTKVCRVCNEETEISLMKKGWGNICKKCECKKAKKYYEEHKEERKQKDKKYREEHKEERKQTSLEYYKKNSAEIIKRQIDYKRKRRAEDPLFKLAHVLRCRILSAINSQAGEKAVSSTELLGSSVQHVRDHLESQFTEGMTWENHGEWHIDHIKPCAKFNLQDPEEQKKCFHWNNLQPLWAKDNLSKGAR